MGLFSGFKNTDPPLSVQKAVMTIVVAAIKADGVVAEAEVRWLQALCTQSPIFSRNSRAEDSEIISFAANFTAQSSIDAIGRAAASLKPEHRETAFAFACEVLLSDGVVGDGEEKFLDMLVQKLQIPHDVATAVIKTTIIRSRSAD